MRRLKPIKTLLKAPQSSNVQSCTTWVRVARSTLAPYSSRSFSKYSKSQHTPGPGKTLSQHRFTSTVNTPKDEHGRASAESLSEHDAKIAEQLDKQQRTPWHREGMEDSPVKKQRSAGAMTKGKLLTTPSRLLKLVLPLSTVDLNSDRKDVAPLALLIHPSQPLSYLTRLIQSELPTITTEKGEQRIPDISFRAMEAKEQDSLEPKKRSKEDDELEDSNEELRVEGGVESYSGAGREARSESDGEFIRWSSSTEIGDFIRDAARAKEFEVEIQGKEDTIKVAVPSFNDRTFYLRQKLRRYSSRLSDMASLKAECDEAARRTGQRYALAGCGALVGYWYLVYRLTFETDLGWDVMEPVTYLVGLSGIIGGYLWFLYHNREVSYRSAMNLTVSRRQSQLYQQRGFDLHKWEILVEEANRLRSEIRATADSYDVQWDEIADEKDPKVMKALRKERERQKQRGSGKKDSEGDDEDD